MNVDSRYIEGEYSDTNPTFHVEDSPWKAEQISAMIEKHRLSPRTVAEIGCGAGEILNQLQMKLPDVEQFVGYEISPQAYALAMERAGKRLKFYNRDLFEVPAAHFDLLLCIDVFEHVPDYLGFLNQLHNHAAHFIFHIPLEMNVQMVLRSQPHLYVREKVGHLHHFSRDTALATLRDSGFTVQDRYYTPSGLALPKSLKAKLGRLPRKLLSSISEEATARLLGGYSLLVYAT